MILSPADFLGMNCLSGARIHHSTDVAKSDRLITHCC